jgi:1-acyl-sn-glycerol-3-phosphate acyltransferase
MTQARNPRRSPGYLQNMGSGRVNRVNRSVRDARVKGTELGRTAASRGAEVGRTAATRGAEIGRNMRSLDVPWARCAPARMVRESILQFVLAPLMNIYTRERVWGREVFDRLPHPVILVANHSSHLDTPTILRALPLPWRQRTAVAAAADYFYKKRGVKELVALIFNTVPLSRDGGGVGNGSTAHVDRLIDQRWNILMFPEGTRSRDGQMHKLRSGAAAIAQQHGIPIVPIYVKGTHDAMPPGRNWPKKRWLLARRFRLEVHFGAPIWPRPDEHRSALMGRVRSFLEAEADIDAPAAPVSAPATVPERSAAPVG